MGYDIHIHRRLTWTDGDKDITTEEWNRLIDEDPELEHTEEVEIPLDGGIFSYRLNNASLSKWTKFTTKEVFWFTYHKGRITIKYNKEEVLLKAIEVAKKLNAKVQGDEGEVYYLPRNNSLVRIDYRKLQKANLPIDFPMIDDINLDAKTVTRMEVLDLSASEHQDVNIIDAIIRLYIDELGIFYVVDWKPYLYRQGREFEDRYLEVGIPAGKATQAQTEKLLELQDYAQTKDVTLVIVEVP